MNTPTTIMRHSTMLLVKHPVILCLFALLWMNACTQDGRFGGEVYGSFTPTEEPLPTPRENIDQPGDDPWVDQSEFLWGLDAIHEFNLELPPAGWDALIADPRTYVPGVFHYDGRDWDVGIRLKGALGSFRALNSGQKCAFKVDFNYFDPAGNFFGIKKLALNNGMQDRSFSSEYLAYKSFGALGVPVPRLGYVSLSVNDQAWGLYMNVEVKDRRFMNMWHEDTSGNLYEGSYANAPQGGRVHPDFVADRSWAFELDVAGYPGDRGDIQAVVDRFAVNDPDDLLAAIDQHFDYDELLHLMAMEIFLTHWDGFSANTNNYHMVYTPTTGRFTISPWGTDQTFDPNDRVDPDPRGFGPYNDLTIIFDRLLDHPQGRADYEDAMRDVIVVFESLDLADDWQQVRDLIVDAVYADPRKNFSNSSFESRSGQVLAFIEDQPDYMRQWVP